MPAIQLARLKIQTEELAEKVVNPGAFQLALHGLLDHYADRTHRLGQVGKPPPLLKAYNVPQPVMRQILSTVETRLAGDHNAILTLSDALWSDATFEFRLLATSLLGRIPVDQPEPILERFTSWANPGTEKRLIDALIENGLVRFRQEQRVRYLEEAAKRLAAESVFVQQLGLRCLEPLVRTLDFEDYPGITRLLAPSLRNGSTALRPDLLRLVKALARRSTKETAFFLRQNLAHQGDNFNTTWLIRHSMEDFPAETQAYLRESLREIRQF